MGTLFRSINGGKTWSPVSQLQVKFNSDLSSASPVGFSSNPKVVFFAEGGKNPKRSLDSGVTWSTIPVPLTESEHIRYWKGDTEDSNFILCGTTEALYRSLDLGKTWLKVMGIDGESEGTVFVPGTAHARIFHAIPSAILVSDDQGKTFKEAYKPTGTSIRAFTGGSDAKGLTLAFLDSDGKNACAWAQSADDASAEQKKNNVKECGFVWIYKNHDQKPELNLPFQKTSKDGGRFLQMAENDSQTLYVTGGDWVRQYGSKIWASKDAGASWKLKLQIFDWDKHPYQPWPKDRLEYSAVGLDVGWDDNFPTSFAVNQRKSSMLGTTGYYFFHFSDDYGDHWKAPFTQFAGTGDRTKGKTWKSTGLEVTSALRMKFHPRNPKIAYVSYADIGGTVTEDGGQSFRIAKVKYNTNYDYAFDPEKSDRAYAASGDQHDFPLNFNRPIVGKGGIFVTDDRGRSWKRLTPDNKEFNRQFLSVAYDPAHHTIYGGTEGAGVARSKDDGKTWAYFNLGFPKGDLLIPQIEVNPKDGTAYALLTGNAPEFLNQGETGIYKLGAESNHWELLRGNVVRPDSVGAQYGLWYFPSAFAVDFSNPKTLWMTDIENKGAWLASGVWKSEDEGKTWKRTLQFTHPTGITLDPKRTANLWVSGLHETSGSWGQGGPYYSTDGGKNWKKNEALPLQANLFNFTLDPNDPRNGFFLFFGGGILAGPKIPGSLKSAL